MKTPALVLAGTLLGALAAGGAARAQDVREFFRAPPRVEIHEGARVGDWLERATTTRAITMRQRTTIVGDRDEAFVIEQTGPAWQGNALRLVVDKKTGKVLEAKAGPPGKPDELRAIQLAPEAQSPLEKAEGEEEVLVEAGAYRCRRFFLEQGGIAKLRTYRFIALDGEARGEVVKEVVHSYDGKKWHETTVFLVDRKAAKLEVAGAEVECWKAVHRTATDGVRVPDVTEWLAKKPLYFNERLLKLESGSANSAVSWGHDGKSVFVPPPAPPPPPPPPPAPSPSPESKPAAPESRPSGTGG